MNADSRPIHVYKIPANLQGCTVREIGLVQLTVADELAGAARVAAAGNSAMRLAQEGALSSLVLADGKKVSVYDGTADKVWEALGPKGRQLAIMAYSKIAMASEQDLAGFLESAEIRVG
jgi:hypothetical protein